MTGYTYKRGNRVPKKPDIIDVFDLDDDELERQLEEERAESNMACATCGLKPVYRDKNWADDACIHDLPGVIAACCGHGVGVEYESLDGVTLDTCYVYFDDGVTLYGNAARAAMEMIGGHPPPQPEGSRCVIPVITDRTFNLDSYSWPIE